MQKKVNVFIARTGRYRHPALLSVPGTIWVVILMSRPYKLPPEIAGRTDLTGTDKVVYAVITYHIGKNRNGYPAIRTIAKESGASPSTVDESVQRLENNNLLRVERPGQRKVRRYSVPEISTDLYRKSVMNILL